MAVSILALISSVRSFVHFYEVVSSASVSFSKATYCARNQGCYFFGGACQVRCRMWTEMRPLQKSKVCFFSLQVDIILRLKINYFCCFFLADIHPLHLFGRKESAAAAQPRNGSSNAWGKGDEKVWRRRRWTNKSCGFTSAARARPLKMEGEALSQFGN